MALLSRLGAFSIGAFARTSVILLTPLPHRLSEDSDVVVGVIEAGEYIPDMPEILIPGLPATSFRSRSGANETRASCSKLFLQA